MQQTLPSCTFFPSSSPSSCLIDEQHKDSGFSCCSAVLHRVDSFRSISSGQDENELGRNLLANEHDCLYWNFRVFSWTECNVWTVGQVWATESDTRSTSRWSLGSCPSNTSSSFFFPAFSFFPSICCLVLSLFGFLPLTPFLLLPGSVLLFLSRHLKEVQVAVVRVISEAAIPNKQTLSGILYFSIDAFVLFVGILCVLKFFSNPHIRLVASGFFTDSRTDESQHLLTLA